MDDFYVLDAKYTCSGCLKISEDLLTMSANEITWYKNNVKVDNMDNIVKICYICRHMMQKLKVFISQCQQANRIMKCVIQGGSESFSKYKPNSCNYAATATVTHYFGPNFEFDIPSYNDDKDLNNEYNDADNINYDDDIKQDVDDDIKHDDDEIKNDDDDIPLVLFKEVIKEEATMNMKKKKKKKQRDHSHEIIKVIKSKQKKQLKEGFSSRMVQETNEYEVIKLTKEQVIQEMAEKSKTDKYLQYLFKCEKCAKGFNFKDVLENHMKKHSQENGTLKCDICEQYCPSTVSLRGHMKSHTTRYKCKVCGAIRNSRQHLLEHHTIEHTLDSSRYTCDHCPFTTNKRTVVQRHVKTHKLGKNLTCSICGAGFNNMHSLRMHSSRHNPTKKYNCSQCDMKFRFLYLLERHRRSHSQQDRYCVECDLTFKTTESLKVHFKRARRHRDPSTFKYKCSQCDERFATPSAALTHLTVSHGGAKTHACSLCGRLYSSRESVRAHERRAHGGGRVSCDLCLKEFTRKYALTKHLKLHTSDTGCDVALITSQKKQENVDAIQTAKLET